MGHRTRRGSCPTQFCPRVRADFPRRLYLGRSAAGTKPSIDLSLSVFLLAKGSCTSRSRETTACIHSDFVCSYSVVGDCNLSVIEFKPLQVVLLAPIRVRRRRVDILQPLGALRLSRHKPGPGCS